MNTIWEGTPGLCALAAGRLSRAPLSPGGPGCIRPAAHLQLGRCTGQLLRGGLQPQLRAPPTAARPDSAAVLPRADSLDVANGTAKAYLEYPETDAGAWALEFCQ